MKTVGIISEYNPFHKGHQYHIEKAREATGAEAVVCIMSGSFVQRGEPAMFDKWSRAKMAVLGGADLVVELPFAYACQPAEIFAWGAVRILDAMKVVDSICFGSEAGEIDPLQKTARLLAEEPAELSLSLKTYLDEGMTYPKAMSKALSGSLAENEGNLLSTPNNVLGIEYIKALVKSNSHMQPVTIKRISNDYNDQEITQPIASATAIRKTLIQEGLTDKVADSLPLGSKQIISELLAEDRQPMRIDNLSDMILYKLRTSTPKELTEYLNIKEGIEHRLLKNANKARSCSELIELIKTKRYTWTYIQRLLCHLLLGLKREQVAAFKSDMCPPYVRILAFNDKGKHLQKQIKKDSETPIISKVANFKPQDENQAELFRFDLLSTDIYHLGYTNLAWKSGNLDFYHTPDYI